MVLIKETGNKRSRRSLIQPSLLNDPVQREAVNVKHSVHNGSHETDKGDLRELETLFGLWRASGKAVNLWDWLEGSRAAILTPPIEGATDDGDKRDASEDGSTRAEQVSGIVRSFKRKLSEEEYDTRTHAAFIRFGEEARMLGLIRAKGIGVGRRANEVIKGIAMI